MSRITDTDTESARDSMDEKNHPDKKEETRTSDSTLYFDIEGIRTDSWAYTVGVHPKTVRRALKSNSHRSLHNRLSLHRLSNSHRFSMREPANSRATNPSSRVNSTVQRHFIRNTHTSSAIEKGPNGMLRDSVDHMFNEPSRATEEIKVWKVPSQSASLDALSNSRSKAMDSNQNSTNSTSAHDWDTSFRFPSPAVPEPSVQNVTRQSSARSSRVQPDWMSVNGSQRRRPLSPLNSSQFWAASTSSNSRISTASHDVPDTLSEPTISNGRNGSRSNVQ